jgi:hypothetical protein
MTRTTRDTKTVKQPWVAPSLTFQGLVGDVLRSGGGKLSITAADPGENRCEKPHADQCNGATPARN